MTFLGWLRARNWKIWLRDVGWGALAGAAVLLLDSIGRWALVGLAAWLVGEGGFILGHRLLRRRWPWEAAPSQYRGSQ